MVRRRGVRVESIAGRIDMDDRIGQIRHVMEKLVVGDLGNLMGFRDR